LIKRDENLPKSLAAELERLGHEVDTITHEGLTGCADSDVWTASQRSKRFLISQDPDFSDVRKYAPGTHSGLLVVRLREPNRKALFERLSSPIIVEQLDSWDGCFVTLMETKIRIRWPGSAT
jgi:predicted nuclease of predicted toxin-antitoxin system